jgi:hypothetical protein
MKQLTTFIIFLFITVSGLSQTIESPKIDRQDNDNIGILEIKKTSSNTIIHFIYQSDNKYIDGGWANINPSIKIKDSDGYKSYDLIRAEGIPLSPEKKQSDFAGQWFSFRLTFPKISTDISKIDIIECSTSNCFNFYGVSLKENKNTTSSEQSSGRFRRDYNVLCFYDSDTEKWSEWKTGDNTFVINYNDNNDIAHYKANGEMVVYKKISGVEDDYTDGGEHYQIISALDEEGIRFRFQFFDDPKIGLKLIYKNIMIQFAKN